MIHLSWGTKLSALSLSGQVVSYVLGIFLARQLGVQGFEVYVVASAAFILMVTLVPQGLEKYSLKLLPILIERGDYGLLRGFLRFSIRRIVLGSVLVGAAVAAWAWRMDGLSTEMRTAIVISCLSLPAGALVHMALEVLTAFGRPYPAAVVFRLLVPATAWLLVLAMWAVAMEMRASWPIAAWGLSWCLALVLMGRHIVQSAPATIFAQPAIERRREWHVAAMPFWIYRISIVVLAQAGVLALEILQPFPSAVGAFTVAMSTAAIARVLVTSTNRVYASRLSVLLERDDMRAIADLRRERLRWLILPVMAYLVLTFLFASPLVGMFRPEFVQEGAPALRVLAVATAISTVLALAPTYLKHQGRNGVLFRQVAIAAVVQMALLALLVPRFGSVGAATAYAIASTFMYASLAWRAHLGLGPPGTAGPDSGAR